MTFSLIFSFKIISSHHKYFKNCVRITKNYTYASHVYVCVLFSCPKGTVWWAKGDELWFWDKSKTDLVVWGALHPHPLLRSSVSAIKTWIFFSILLQVFFLLWWSFSPLECVKVANFPLRCFWVCWWCMSQEVFSPKMCVSEELSILFLLNMSCVCVDVFVDSFSWCNILADACVET